MSERFHICTTRRKGRPNRLTYYDSLELPALRSVWLLSIVPAFVFSCSPSEKPVPERKETQIYITKAEKTTVGGMDLFFFYAEEPQKLDAYQHFNAFESPAVLLHAGSTTGERRIALIANRAETDYPWTEILSFRNLSAQCVRFEDERPSAPIMTGTTVVRAGSESQCEVSLTPLLVCIRIHSLCCDFHGRPYEGAALKKVRIYLTYAKASTPLFGGKGDGEWINAGRLSENDMGRLKFPEMICRSLEDPVGEAVINPGMTLYCYPNGGEEEDLANRWTRLVIEGELEGETCYYAVSLGQLESGTEHIFDFVITRRGTPDPDTLADSGMIQFCSSLVPWRETDYQTETY